MTNLPRPPLLALMAVLFIATAAAFAADDDDTVAKPTEEQPAQSADLLDIGNIKAAKDFKIELVYTVPKQTEGSWVAMCIDPKGRLIVSDQNGALYRVQPPPIGQSSPIEPEPIDLDVGGAHGLLYAFDSLYVMVDERGGANGLYRVRDTNGDDRFD